MSAFGAQSGHRVKALQCPLMTPIAALLLVGRYEESSLVAQAALQQYPTFLPLLRVAVASYALAGQ
jgi:hypothetical protein